MVRVYFDIGTYKKDKEFINEKIIAIGLTVDWTSYSLYSLNDSNNVQTHILTEWGTCREKDNTEKCLLEEFYKTLDEVIKEQSRFINLVGFNILRVDVPLITQKTVGLGIKSFEDINSFFHSIFITDYFQIGLALNNMTFLGNSLKNLARKLNNKFGYSIPLPKGNDRDIADMYESGRYNEIEEYLKSYLETIRAIDLYYGASLYHRNRRSQQSQRIMREEENVEDEESGE